MPSPGCVWKQLTDISPSSLEAHWHEACKCFRFLCTDHTNLVAHHYIDPHYFAQVSEFARTWMADRINYARSQFGTANTAERDYVMAELKKLEDKIPGLKYAFE